MVMVIHVPTNQAYVWNRNKANNYNHGDDENFQRVYDEYNGRPWILYRYLSTTFC